MMPSDERLRVCNSRGETTVTIKDGPRRTPRAEDSR